MILWDRPGYLLDLRSVILGLEIWKYPIFFYFFFFFPLNEQATLLSWNDFAKLHVEGVCNVVLVIR